MLDSASTPLAGCQAGAFVGKPVANSWDPSTPIHGSFSSSAYAHIADNSSIVPVHKSIPVAATTARLWTVNGKSRQLYACSASPHVSDAKGLAGLLPVAAPAASVSSGSVYLHLSNGTCVSNAAPSQPDCVSICSTAARRTSS